ncbi:MAG: DUF192 domain-containing protein [bacterium]|nr:DUF192 domain-containing protein [bacterium]
MVGTGVVFFYRTASPVQQAGQTAEFGGVSLRIEYATTSAARERGLGGRASIPNDYGMLFVFPRDDKYGFWMKDTLVPLDIFWLDAKGQVIYIAPDVATSTYPNVLYPSAPARYVLETAAGFAKAHDIVIGTPLLLKNLPSVTQ